MLEEWEKEQLRRIVSPTTGRDTIWITGLHRLFWVTKLPRNVPSIDHLHENHTDAMNIATPSV